jgi:hypothetical protein
MCIEFLEWAMSCKTGFINKSQHEVYEGLIKFLNLGFVLSIDILQHSSVNGSLPIIYTNAFDYFLLDGNKKFNYDTTQTII